MLASGWPHRRAKPQHVCKSPYVSRPRALAFPKNSPAMTLHRLLGWQRGSSSRFKYNATNRLPYDVVVVDETSMVSLTLMAACSRPFAPMPVCCLSAI